MKRVERLVDRLSPSLSVQLRLLQKKLRHDMSLRVIGALVGPGDAVLDVGAYRGTYTVALSRLVGPQGRVWAVEPYPANAEALARIASRRPNITVCPWAASAHTGTERLSVPVYEGHRLGALATLGGIGVSSDSIEIESRTVDGLLDGGDQPGPLRFMRCDVVGHEAAVLAGAARTLRLDQPCLFVEIEQRHQARPIQATLDLLRDHGYDGYFLLGDRFRPVAEFDLERHQLAFVTPTFVPYGMPPGYVHYFLFVRPGTALGGLPMG